MILGQIKVNQKKKRERIKIPSSNENKQWDAIRVEWIERASCLQELGATDLEMMVMHMRTRNDGEHPSWFGELPDCWVPPRA